ncbi:MAG: polysaccharide biosynthesis protein [Phycisphaerae bacterium]|nr:polysaccharide biosynthesis protein [Saprospiraceae bacterium]
MPSLYNSIKNRKWAGYRTKWLIFGLDIFASAFSIFAAILLSYEFQPEKAGLFYSWAIAVLLGLRILSFIWFRTYSIVVRYIGEKDYKTSFLAVTSASCCFYLIYGLLPPVLAPAKLAPILLIDGILCLCSVVAIRVLLRLAYDRIKKNHAGIPTAIFGAGELGVMVERILRNNTSHPYRIMAFFDDSPQIYGKLLNGVRVFDPEKSFLEVILKHRIQHVIIGIDGLSPERRIAFIHTCLENNVKVLKIPPAELWMNGTLNIGQLKNINFEDLLNRPPIELDQEGVQNSIRGRVVLVTGCAGSIGSEIVHQLLRYQPATVIGLDQAETPLADITLKLKDQVEQGMFLPIIGDVRDRDKIQRIFEEYRPVYIFHAAAYKHVPIMEIFPEQAIKVNVEGTQNMADLAVQYGVEKFVMISTDKVINPSNVMGASKRIAEIYTQSLNFHANHYTQFITTRFGNVLGSNGSVIPIFLAQIENREPITLTHPDVSRYFMTIPEACQLVLEAGAMGKGGEIFVFDMGEPVRILDLAHKMIQMAGLVVEKDIMIKITGLRPGEKLTEELLDYNENTLPTHHPKIKKAKVRICDYSQVKPEIDLLIHHANSGLQSTAIVQHMKHLVPEYTSQNSKYSTLDIA